MEFTGERFIPPSEGIADEHLNLEYEHIHRYQALAKIVTGRSVLDVASGDGYGSALLAKHASSVVGIDISEEAVANAIDKYCENNTNLRYIQGSVTDLPLDNNSIDVVVSFETIEHIYQHEEMLAELKRVMKEDAVLIISTPDKAIYSDATNYKNEYHVKELYKDEFETLLTNYFKKIELYGQRFVTCSALYPLESSLTSPLSFSGESIDPPVSPVYLIAICSNMDVLPKLEAALYFEANKDIYERDQVIMRWASGVNDQLFSVHNELIETRRSMGTALSNAENELKILRQHQHEVDSKYDIIDQLKNEINSKNSLIQNLENQVAADSTLIEQLKNDIISKINSIEELTKTYNQFKKELEAGKIQNNEIEQKLLQSTEENEVMHATNHSSWLKTQEVDSQNKSMRLSKSWKVIGPLRSLIKRLRRGSR